MYSVQASFFTVKQGPFSAVVNVSTDEGGNNVHRESIKRNLRKIYTVESATTSLEKNTYQKKQALVEVWEKSKKTVETLACRLLRFSQSISCSSKLPLVFLLIN